MANEANISELSGLNPIRFIVDPSINVSKGTLMNISADYAVKKSADGDTGAFAGIAAADHKTGEGETEIALYVPGQMNVFDIKTHSAGAVIGSLVRISGANIVGPIMTQAGTGLSSGKVVGKALETASANEVIRVLV